MWTWINYNNLQRLLTLITTGSNANHNRKNNLTIFLIKLFLNPNDENKTTTPVFVASVLFGRICGKRHCKAFS